MFAFAGRTNYWQSAGRGLYAHEPAFRAAIQECERITVQVLGGPPLQRSFEGPADEDFEKDERIIMHTSVVMQLALVELCRANGLRADALLGISLGEIAAVYAAGGLTLEDALRVSACYYTYAGLVEPSQAILHVSAAFDALDAVISQCPIKLSILLVLAPDRCYATCPAVDLASAVDYLAARGVGAAPLGDARFRPYHSLQATRYFAAVREPLRALQPLPLSLPCYLSAVGRVVPAGAVLGGDYWLNLLFYPAHAYAAIRAAVEDNHRLVVPIGGEPFLYYDQKERERVLASAQALSPLMPGESETEWFDDLRREIVVARRNSRVPAAPPRDGPSAVANQMNRSGADLVADPGPSFAFLARHGGIHHLPETNRWLVIKADLMEEVLRQPELFSSRANAVFDPELSGADPPGHTITRAMLQPFFSPERMAALGDFAIATLDEMAAGLAERASFDFVTDLATPLTQAIGGRFIGLTCGECALLRERLPAHPCDGHLSNAFSDTIAEILRNHETPVNPSALVDALLAATRTAELTFPAIVSLTKTLWAASTLTSSLAMSSAALHLLSHSATADELRANPGLVNPFVEEILRLAPPISGVGRTTTRSTILGGLTLPAGAEVMVSLLAANRDRDRFADPDVVNLQRSTGRHFSFSSGVHTCMGAFLARLEIRLMVQWLLQPANKLRLASPSTLPKYHPEKFFRALANLPVTSRPFLR